MTQVHTLSQSSFTKNAALYDSARPSYIPSAVDAICRMCKIQPTSKVLDLAAGTGIFTRLLHDRGIDVTACEPSPGMRKTFSSRSNIPIVDGSAYSIPFPDNTFDTITIAQAFHWFADHEALLEIHRVLKSGGSLGCIWNLENYRSNTFQDPYFEAVVRYDAGLPQYRRDTWKAVLRETNLFTPYEQWMEEFDLFYTEEELWSRAQSKSFITSLSTKEQKTLETELSNIIASHPDAERKDGKLKCPHIVRVIATFSQTA